ncbi:MAG: elongation factor G [SAR202 cluster bacterium]|nr:elongation factor G [SAR202 cluster bacterium]|tara:strand:- start:1833 stop:3869 length:2037 start_codon:yes stop_codon:yes gene_type:complete
MSKIDGSKIRNVALLSHSGAGKTVITESALFEAKMVSRFGTITDANTVSDYEPEEHKRQTSVQTSIVSCVWNDHKINFIDTPGFADYYGEVLSGVAAADIALLTISAVSGIEVGTEQMWHLASKCNLATIIVVNKMDRDNINFVELVEELRDKFGRECVPIQIPVGEGPKFSGINNLFNENAGDTDDGELLKEQLIEAVAETDDDLMMKYLEGESLSEEDIVQGIKLGVKDRKIIPIVVTSALNSLGVKELLDALVNIAPSPLEASNSKMTGVGSDNKSKDFQCDVSSSTVGRVFKTTADPYVGKLSYLRIHAGKINSDSSMLNANTGKIEKLGQLYFLNGKSQETTDSLSAGDIGAVAKVEGLNTGSTLSDKDNHIKLDMIEFPDPVYYRAVYPKSKADLDKMTTAMSRIAEEDPALKIVREKETLELLLGGAGDTHLEVTLEKMKRKFAAEIELKVPKIAYKETIMGSSRVEYRHKKQSGGHGQFGHVWLEIKSLSRGSGFEFESKIVGGVVPREYIPAVEKGCNKSLESGVIGGFPVVDVKAALVDGSFHPVDSSGVCFEIAGEHAMSDGLNKAKPILLEPIMFCKVIVPDTLTGDVVGDLNGKRARILGMLPDASGSTVIEAEVPQVEMLSYSSDLRSQTQGRGTFTLEFRQYEQVPEHLVTRVVESTKDSESS